MQKIALIFAGIHPLEQPDGRSRTVDAGVMAGCNPVAAQTHRVIEKSAELDSSVAGNIRVRRPPTTILLKKIGKHLLAVLAGKIDPVQRNIEIRTNLARVLVVLRRCAVLAVVVPVAHMQALDGVAIAEQHQRGHGRIHAAGHANDDRLFGCAAHPAIVAARAVQLS